MAEMQKGKNIESISKMMQISKEWQQKTEYGLPKTWYRGQSQDWPLCSGACRDTFEKQAIKTYENDSRCKKDVGGIDRTACRMYQEHDMTVEFMRQADIFVPEHTTLVEKYFLAQHHGFPTRLLDWTINPLIALYFACLGAKNKDGCVYAFNPRELVSSSRKWIRPQALEFIEKYKKIEKLELYYREFRRLVDIFPSEEVGPDHPYVEDAVNLISNSAFTNDEQERFYAYRTLAIVLPIYPNIGQVSATAGQFFC